MFLSLVILTNRDIRSDEKLRRQIRLACIRTALLKAGPRECVYCRRQLSHTTATIDHVQPRSRGGDDALGNLVLACWPCNSVKSNLMPIEFFAGVEGGAA